MPARAVARRVDSGDPAATPRPAAARRITAGDTAVVALVATFAVEIALLFAALASLGDAPVESFHRAMLGVGALGVALALVAEIADA